MTEYPEDLLALIFGFSIAGKYLYPAGAAPGHRRLATAEEKAMWAALMYQAQKSLEQPPATPGEEETDR